MQCLALRALAVNGVEIRNWRQEVPLRTRICYTIVDKSAFESADVVTPTTDCIGRDGNLAER